MTVLPDIPTADLARVVAAVRAIDVGRAELLSTPTPNARVVHATRLGSTRVARAALVLLFVLPAIFMHSTRGRAWISSPTSVLSAEEFDMHRIKVMAFAGTAAGLTALSSVGDASAQDAVEWRVQDGGNGHWYQAMRPSPMPVTFTQQDTFASSVGGYIATLTTEAENSFVIDLLGSNAGETNGVFFGLRRQADGSWLWRDGTTVDFTAWGNSQCVSGPYPNDTGIAGEVCGHLYLQNCGWIWDDTPPYWFSTATNLRLLVEYSADCNSDGVVDYGQIRAGELVDVNANNIPDCCEESTSCSPCLGDIDESGTVNGVDLAAILAVWGSDGGKYPRADTNNDGEVNGADLATVLGSWGPCE